jgi:hypothetical protein
MSDSAGLCVRGTAEGRSRPLLYAGLVAAGIMLGCAREATVSVPVAVVCADPRAGLAIYIADAPSGRAIASNTMTVATLSPIYADTTRAGAAFPDTAPVLAGYHSGTFRVTVTRPGYAPWTGDQVVVKASPAPCEGNPFERVRVDARLVPQGP